MAEISMKELSHELRAAIDELKAAGTTQDTGVVIRVGDGICWIYGLSKAGYNEMLEIEGTDGSKITAFALNLMQDEIGAVILGVVVFFATAETGQNEQKEGECRQVDF